MISDWTAKIGATDSIITSITSGIVIVFLSWTIIVLYSHKKTWRTLDSIIFLLLIGSIIRLICSLIYCCIILLQIMTLCPIVSFIMSSTHTLQALILTTLSLTLILRIRFTSIKYQNALNKSHIIYHSICLLLLSCCIGMIAILANNKDEAYDKKFECILTDKRYAIFYITLHLSLFILSIFSLIYGCLYRNNTYINKNNLLLNSTSDISSGFSDISMITSKRKLSLSSNVNNNNIKIGYSVSDCSNARYRNATLVSKLLNAKYLQDYTYSATSASSTNSRSVCFKDQYPQKDVCLATVSAIVTMSYVINHLPVIVSMILLAIDWNIFPTNWPHNSFPLWTAITEGFLLPIILFMFDDQFVPRVAALYRKSSTDKDVYGKFRAYNGALVDINAKDDGNVRFPITNGSLFTSIDGRIPVVHNYRRTRGIRTGSTVSTLSPRPWYAPTDSFSAHIIEQDVQKPEEEPKKEIKFGNVHQLQDALFADNVNYDSDDYDDSEDPTYATLSMRSTCSATTAANDDFEYFNSKVVSKKPLNSTAQCKCCHLSPKRRIQYRHSGRPLARRLGIPPTPPTKKRLTTVLSVDSIVTALNDENYSYLDTGDVYRLHPEITCSVPDLKKIFITDFL